ncbi:hypothetical protein CHARACLAT_023976 [Characodon lateralis]|uniref:Uncharacterized protein n=1 Tax=Characodon lateralis TaxID=208331 RepID=A0ABU7DMB6_9TELE|nr:hypothetical protein [Characodon lateralis]
MEWSERMKVSEGAGVQLGFLLLGEPLDPTQRNIHLPVHPPLFASSRSGVFSPRKKGQLSNWRSQELFGSLPANYREGLIPLPPYPASHSITPVLTRLPSSWFLFILASTV